MPRGWIIGQDKDKKMILEDVSYGQIWKLLLE